MTENYLLENPDWKMDKIPEIYDGKNVYDFIDPDIEQRLAELEAEEEQLQESGFYDEPEDIEDEEEAEIRTKADYIREQQALIRNAARSRKSTKNRAVIPRSAGQGKKLSDMEAHLDKLGLDSSNIAARARSISRGRAAARAAKDTDSMDLDEGFGTKNKMTPIERAKSRARSINRREDGIADEPNRTKAEKLAKLQQKRMNRMARQGESDRHVSASLPKHLVCFIILTSSLPISQFTDYQNSSRESVVWERHTGVRLRLWRSEVWKWFVHIKVWIRFLFSLFTGFMM